MIEERIAAYLILGSVTLQRIGELALARRNTRRLIARGASEYGRGHYPLIVLLHAFWLCALWWLAPGQPISWPLLAVFLLLQLARLWVVATLGERWTTRVIVLPGEPLVRRGPYRFLSHPNYWVVALEIALLPLVFGLAGIAVLFSLANAILLSIRVRCEDRALRHSALACRTDQAYIAGSPRHR